MKQIVQAGGGLGRPRVHQGVYSIGTPLALKPACRHQTRTVCKVWRTMSPP